MEGTWSTFCIPESRTVPILSSTLAHVDRIASVAQHSGAMMSQPTPAELHNDHNVYILGAGFSVDAGMPVVRNFLRRMRDSLSWLEGQERNVEVFAVRDVLVFFQKASAAAYRTKIDPENIEELFSLASATGDEGLTRSMVLAVAATLDFARSEGLALARVEPVTIQNNLQAKIQLPWRPAEDQSGIADGWTLFLQAPHDIYVASMLGLFNPAGAGSRNTFITFNYDLVLEDALRNAGFGIDYGVARTRLAPQGSLALAQKRVVPVLKLHGSVNWVQGGSANGEAMAAYESYEMVRTLGKPPVLVPPTWRKDFSGHFSDVWNAALAAVRTATRLCIIGFSLPETDVHFRYLLAAGLQENISLRRISFADPSPERVEERASLVLREELKNRGMLQFRKATAAEFLRDDRSLTEINRPIVRGTISWGGR